MIVVASCCIALAPWLAPVAVDPHPGWDVVASDGRTTFEVDRRRVMRSGHGVVRLHVRARAPLGTVVAEFEDYGVDAATLQHLRSSYDHSEHRWTFRCEDGTHALLGSTYYAADRQPIREFVVEAPGYWPVREGTVGGTLMRLACGAPRAAPAANVGLDQWPPPWRDGRDAGAPPHATSVTDGADDVPEAEAAGMPGAGPR